MKAYVQYKPFYLRYRVNAHTRGCGFGSRSPHPPVHVSICYISSTLSAFFPGFSFLDKSHFSCVVKNHGGKMLLFRDDGDFFPFCFELLCLTRCSGQP